MQQAAISKNTFRALGIMSGTSLDGLDLCIADYQPRNSKWNFTIRKAITIDYDDNVRERLENGFKQTGNELASLHAWYGQWIAERVNESIGNLKSSIDIIGSHGHTIFHNPTAGYTTQIGSGAHIAAITGIPCICDFRSGDIARGGQGAPLVPIGDQLLFGDYDMCLNIGGIANISYASEKGRIAYDICPANMALNYLANRLNLPIDRDGALGKTGQINAVLLDTLNHLEYYAQHGAKSLGREWFEQIFLPVIMQQSIGTVDTLRTVYEHISIKINESFLAKPNGRVLVTGGGAKNKFLINLIEQKYGRSLSIPSNTLIDSKEALVFGFLAVLYLTKTSSSLSSVTGAKSDSIGGCLYF